MSLTSLLDRITNRQQQRRQSRWADYRTLVAEICDGKEPDADTIAGVLADNDKTLDELRSDAQLLARRRKLRAEMDAIEPLEREAKKVDKQLAEAEQAFEAMTAKHEEQTTPLYIRRNEINGIRKRANQARQDLRNTCEDREIVADYEAITEQLNAAEHNRATLSEEIGRRENWKRQDEEKAEATAFDHERKRYTNQAKEHARVLADLHAKLEPADVEVACLQERLSQLEEQMLEP
ncbi:hypothetical protein [Crateriforma conspicua]|uniref:Uncharacterized protein n=1 Tax=Crateriforma conspicua TaxID=2527996 RepID=A0A5C5Y9C4_9PLAN|nr:hypothetical protein [Crateriforma conspicua]TWT71519.1 hypothetical protein Pan14r_38290 [Crateriforma conspicua]